MLYKILGWYSLILIIYCTISIAKEIINEDDRRQRVISFVASLLYIPIVVFTIISLFY